MLVARIVRGNPGLLVAIVLVTALPVGILGVAANLVFEEPEGPARVAILGSLSLISAVLILPFSAVAATVATMDLLGGARACLGRSFAPVRRRFVPLAATLLIVAVGVAAGLTILVVPGVVLLVVWLFAGQAAVVEELDPRGALARSFDLVRRGWWQVLAAFVALQAAASLGQYLLSLPVARATEGLGRPRGATVPSNAEVLANGVAEILALVIVQPFVVVAFALLYLDRRSRADGAWPAPLDRLRS